MTQVSGLLRVVYVVDRFLTKANISIYRRQRQRKDILLKPMGGQQLEGRALQK
jgi:hypothetical protein